MAFGIHINEKGPGSQYRGWVLREEPGGEPLDEMEVQRLWFEQAYRSPLRTTEGEEVEVLQPGFWNKGGGPDFSHAAIRTGAGVVECGAVEVHLEPRDWTRHHHDRDRQYDPVILHVVWQAGPESFFPLNSAGGRVRQVVLAPQLKGSLMEARRAFRSTAAEREAGARLGRCHEELARLSEEERRGLMREAGWFRFFRRVERFRARENLVGRDQALWQGLADALGYAANRDAFGWLARRLPISRVVGWRTGLEREAWLYGVAGLLPDRLGAGPGKEWPRRVWDLWWRKRGGEGDPELPAGRWVRRGQRPVNRPERRMAVLSAVGGAGMWGRLMRGVAAADTEGIGTLLETLEHPFWSRRLAWSGRVLSKPLALVGPGRVRSFLFNTAWPAAWADAPERVRAVLEAAPAATENFAEHRASVRLFGRRRPAGLKFLEQEGLIQIYQDFCLSDHRQCLGCDFPSWVRAWRSRG
ncbi:MAG: DUF2851 family protein [Candidatus Methylacidiphilales bacterium]|nr:DUF2851 family protein [Candidatus Methylacidiphilales bacterium]